jgi:hypothetical protein
LNWSGWRWTLCMDRWWPRRWCCHGDGRRSEGREMVGWTGLAVRQLTAGL